MAVDIEVLMSSVVQLLTITVFESRCGHPVEAALSHRGYYNNDLLLEPILKYVGYKREVIHPVEVVNPGRMKRQLDAFEPP